MTILQTELSYDQYLTSYKHFFCPKIALQKVLQKANFQVLFATRLWAYGDFKVTETHLK